jgi:hypothetical protein
MKLKLRYFLSFIFIAVCCCACKQDDPLPSSLNWGYDYFPVNTGHTIVYDFDSIFVDTKVAVNETIHSQLKEYIESVFADNSNRPTQRIERYTRKSDSAAWVIKNVWAANRTKGMAERLEYNQRLIKLVFPLKLNQTWKGNAYTTLPAWDYEYTAVDEKGLVGAVSFDSTLTVTQVNDFNLIEQNYFVETYAKHIGLVYRQNLHIEKTPAGVVTKASVNTYRFRSFIP